MAIVEQTRFSSDGVTFILILDDADTVSVDEGDPTLSVYRRVTGYRITGRRGAGSFNFDVMDNGTRLRRINPTADGRARQENFTQTIYENDITIFGTAT